MATMTAAKMLSVLTHPNCLAAHAMTVLREMAKSALVSCA